MGQPCVPTYSLILIFLMQFYSIRVEVKQHGKNTLSQLHLKYLCTFSLEMPQI